MTTGELWVEHPLFPWLIIVLAWWVLCSTAVMVRNWVRLCKLEQHNKLLQEMGVGNLARVKPIEGTSQSVESPEECPSELCPEKAGIRVTEEPAAAIEETEENGNDLAATEREDQKRESVRST